MAVRELANHAVTVSGRGGENHDERGGLASPEPNPPIPRYARAKPQAGLCAKPTEMLFAARAVTEPEAKSVRVRGEDVRALRVPRCALAALRAEPRHAVLQAR